MADVKWIKIATDIFDDDKILLIETLPDADSIIVIWFKLLCLAGKQNNSGVFLLNDRIAYTDKMLSTIFRRKESTVKLALETFESFGMIEIVDDVITIPNWGKHQNLDQLEAKTEYMRNYMREYRAKQKQIASKTNCKTNSKSNVSEADKRLEEDKDIDIDIDREKEKKGRFTPPSVEEARECIREKGYHVDAEAFVSFYQSNGWMVGKNKMKDWKSALVTWEKREKKEAKPKLKSHQLSERMSHDYDLQELARKAKE